MRGPAPSIPKEPPCCGRIPGDGRSAVSVPSFFREWLGNWGPATSQRQAMCLTRHSEAFPRSTSLKANKEDGNHALGRKAEDQ